MKDDQFNSFPQGMYYAHYFKGGHIDQSAFEELSGTYNVPCMECWSLLIKFDNLCSARVISQRFFPKGNFKAFKFFLGAHVPLEITPVSQWVNESQKSLKHHGLELSCMVPYGFLWPPIDLYGPVWSLMAQ